MGFEPIITVPGFNPKRGSISYKRNHRKTHGPANPHLVIGIPKDVINGVVSAGDCFELQLGDGDDAGKVRLLRVERGGVAAHILRGSVTLHFGYVPRLGNDAAAKEEIEVRSLGKGAFEFDAPKWFK